MSHTTPQTQRKRRRMLPTPAAASARAHKRVQRVPGTKLTQEEIRMVVNVHKNLQLLDRDHHRPHFKSPADRAAFLTQVDAQVIRNATKYIDSTGELPGEEDTSR